MHTLNVCTIYPEKISIYTKLNEILLNTLIGDKVKLVYRYIKAGFFKKGTGDDSYQIIQRNKYMQDIPIGEFLIVLDSDNQISGAIELIPDLLTMMKSTDIQVAHVTEVRPDLKMFSRPLIMYKNEELYYHTKHDEILNVAGENIVHIDYPKRIKAYPIQISHHIEAEFSLV